MAKRDLLTETKCLTMLSRIKTVAVSSAASVYKEHTADFLSIVVIIHGNDGKTGAFVLWQRTGVI